MLTSNEITLSNVKTRFLGYDKNEANSKISIFTMEYQKLKTKNEEYLDRIQRLEAALSGLNLTKYELEKQIDNQKKEISDLKYKIDKLEKEISNPIQIEPTENVSIKPTKIITNDDEDIFVGEVEDKKKDYIMIGQDEDEEEGFQFI